MCSLVLYEGGAGIGLAYIKKKRRGAGTAAADTRWAYWGSSCPAQRRKPLGFQSFHFALDITLETIGGKELYRAPRPGLLLMRKSFIFTQHNVD